MASTGQEQASIKPCPFCGATPNADDPATFVTDWGIADDKPAGKWGWVQCCCNGPDVRTGLNPVSKWRDDAIAAWNERTSAQAGT